MAGIDRINGTDQIVGTTINNRRVENKSTTDSGGFALPDEKDREGVIYEPSTQKEEKPRTRSQVMEDIAREEREQARRNLHSRFDGPGVEVELSTEAVEKAATGEKQESLGDIIRDIFRGIRNFFVTLWVGPDGEKASAQAPGTTVEDTESSEQAAEAEGAPETTLRSEAPLEPVDREPLKTGMGESFELDNDPESIATFMNNYGGRKLAKNSDLLTQYDRSGHLVSPSASDRRRILQGEGNIKRY